MLQEKQQACLASNAEYGIMLIQHRASEDATEPEERNAPLEDAAQNEREYVRQRLREESKSEPTEEEVDEWLRQHTEGY